MGSGVGFTLHITSSEWFSYLLFMWSVLEVVQGLALRLCVTSQACAEHKEYFSYTCSFSSFWRSGIVGTWYLLQPFKWTPVVADDCNPWFRSFEVKVEVPADSVGFQTKPLAVVKICTCLLSCKLKPYLNGFEPDLQIFFMVFSLKISAILLVLQDKTNPGVNDCYLKSSIWGNKKCIAGTAIKLNLN